MNFDLFDLLDLSPEQLLFQNPIVSYGKNTKQYLVDALSLLDFLTPIQDFIYTKRNRPIDNSHVLKIKSSQEKQYETFGYYPILSSMICLAKCPEIGLKILDGQHRLFVLSDLAHWHRERFTDAKIVVKIFTAQDEAEMYAHFVEINDNHMPVSKYYIDEDMKKIVDIIVRKLNSTYSSDFFTTAKTSHRPNISTEALPKELSSSQKVKEFVELSEDPFDKTADALFAIFKSYNDYLSRLSYAGFMKSASDNAVFNAHKKCFEHKTPLYLGLYSGFEWIANAFEHNRKKIIVKIAPKFNKV